MWLTIALIACNSSEPGSEIRGTESSFPSQEFGAIDAVAAADLDGDGVDEIVQVVDNILSWPGGQISLDCAVQVTARGRLSGGGEQVFLGCGMDRIHRSAPARIVSVGIDGAKTLLERKSERAQVADLRVVEGRLWAAIFSSRFEVEGGWVENGGLTPVQSGRLATQQLPLKDGGVLLGRVYGEVPRAGGEPSDGDLRWVREEGTQVLPTWRGIRSLASSDLDQDGDLDLLVGDGWHFAYAEQARARLLLLEGPDWTAGRTVGFFPEEYTVRSIHPLPEGILAVGTTHVYWLSRDDLGWSSAQVGEIRENGNAVPVRTRGGLGVLLSGPSARLMSLEAFE